MPPRWITEEDWLRTAGAPEESSHVSPEPSPATVGVRPLSPQGEPPPPQKELRGAVEGTRKRFRIVTTAALAFGGLGLILATMFYPFEVVDQRAVQAFKAPPRMIQPEPATETVGSAAASPEVSHPMPVTQQTAAGQTTRMPDPMLNTQQNVHKNAHHGSKTHGKRFARGRHSAGSSLAFFPFR